MHKRKLMELNLLDDFFFAAVVNHPVVGTDFARKLLEIIFQRPFGNLKVTPQKPFQGVDTDLHGARLDVYLESNEGDPALLDANTVYDVEPNLRRDTDLIQSLPRRVRFYHAKIDAESLTAGEDYSTLKNVIVIMIIPYDPFGLNRMIYTIRNKCEEAPDLDYEDGARTLFLYTKGTEGDPPRELCQLLRYLEDTRIENAKNKDLQELHRMVDTVRKDRKAGLDYMKSYERDLYYFKQGQKEEQTNTERERLRAEEAEALAGQERSRAAKAEAENLRLLEEIQSLKKLLAQ